MRRLHGLNHSRVSSSLDIVGSWALGASSSPKLSNPKPLAPTKGKNQAIQGSPGPISTAAHMIGQLTPFSQLFCFMPPPLQKGFSLPFEALEVSGCFGFEALGTAACVPSKLGVGLSGFHSTTERTRKDRKCIALRGMLS